MREGAKTRERASARARESERERERERDACSMDRLWLSWHPCNGSLCGDAAERPDAPCLGLSAVHTRHHPPPPTLPPDRPMVLAVGGEYVSVATGYKSHLALVEIPAHNGRRKTTGSCGEGGDAKGCGSEVCGFESHNVGSITSIPP